MLVDVGCDAAVLQGAELAQASWSRSVHRAAVEALAVHGRLIFVDQEALEAFYGAVLSLPSSVQPLWSAALADRRIECVVASVRGLPSLSETSDRSTLRTTWAKAVDVVMIDEFCRELLNYGDQDLPDPSGDPEVVDLQNLADSTSLRRARVALQSPLLIGERRQDLWKARFLPVVRHTKRLTLYDRFAGSSLIQHQAGRRRGASGVAWLAQMAERAGVADFTVYTAWGSEGMDPVTKDELRSAAEVQRKLLAGAMSFHIVACRKNNTEHDRHLRFDQRAAVGLGRGSDIFADDKITETSTLGLLDPAIAQDRERSLDRASKREGD